MNATKIILLASLTILILFSNCINAQTNKLEKLLIENISPLMQRILTDKTIDYSPRWPTFDNYTAAELMQLCEEYGRLYKEEKKMGEAACFMIPYFLKAADIRNELDLHALINVTKDKNAPKLWRKYAARVVCGREFLIPIERIDMEKIYNVFTRIIKDNTDDVNLRNELEGCLTSQLAEQYYWIIFPEKMKTKITRRTIDEKEFKKALNSESEKVRKHDYKIEKYMDFLNGNLMSEDMPKELKGVGLDIIKVRGAQTPGLAKIKKTLESLVPPIPEVTIAEVDSITSNKITNLEKHIENGSYKAPQLRKTQERILQQAATKDFTDSQKTYLSTLNEINRCLSRNQN